VTKGEGITVDQRAASGLAAGVARLRQQPAGRLKNHRRERRGTVQGSRNAETRESQARDWLDGRDQF